MALLEVHDLRTSFATPEGEVRAVDGVSFTLGAGSTFCLVGESGSGKTMTALSILRLVPPPGRITSGRVLFDGRDLVRASEAEMRAVRGNAIAMVFQEPTTSLNPLYTVGAQITEAIRLHQRLGRNAARRQAIEMLALVDIPEPGQRADAYPHQLSGGMRQRVMIAMALSCRPRMLIADEPTTALDVTIQAEILDLLADLQARLAMAVLLVTHDLGIVAERAAEVGVMYAGRLVEHGPVAEVFAHPLHPYTQGLLRSLPRVGGQRRRLEAIAGVVPELHRLPSGCRFRDRCVLALPECASVDPVLEEHRPGHRAACLLAAEQAAAAAPASNR